MTADVYDESTNLLYPGHRQYERPFPLLPVDSGVVWVPTADGVQPSVAYTVGLGDRPGREYEIAVFGLPLHPAYALALAVAETLVRNGQDPADGLELEGVVDEPHLVRLRRVQDTSLLEGVGDVPVWQPVVSDKWGRFPGDPHHDASYPFFQPLP
ncbi:DUF4262 domain-containing protein [Streptomyces sp. DT224]|uniref:DUF4262 domain-containing protein n=1 Tax=Streptomyces sp. DT224 TaxID=3393426 RepID=UPI003CEA6117